MEDRPFDEQAEEISVAVTSVPGRGAFALSRLTLSFSRYVGRTALFHSINFHLPGSSTTARAF